MLHWIFRKSKKKKGFSLIELLVVVGIMGLLAAIAIPAYNTYRRDAQAGVINATSANIQRAWPACLTTSTFAQCADDSIMGTINPTGGSRIYSNMTAQNVCYGIELGGTLGTGMNAGTPDFSGCVGFVNDNVGTQQNSSQGFPIGSNCTIITPEVFCTAGTPGSPGTKGTIPAPGTMTAAQTCQTFGCAAGAMTGTCATTASIHEATAVDTCTGGNTNMAVVAECDGTTAKCE